MFAGFGFLAFYIAGKLQTFSPERKGQSFRLIAFLLPFIAALAVGLSRIRDHWHHWEGEGLYAMNSTASVFSMQIHYVN